MKNNIIQFPNQPHKIGIPISANREWITVPDGATASDNFCIFRVNGDALRDVGINIGDVLVCRKNFDLSEIQANRISIFFYDGELQAKRIKNNVDSTVTIISADGEQTVFADEIEIRALAIEHKRKI